MPIIPLVVRLRGQVMAEGTDTLCACGIDKEGRRTLDCLSTLLQGAITDHVVSVARGRVRR